MTESGQAYIQVILPLKLDWVPFYRVPGGGVNLGEKVKVIFAGKEYTGVAMSVASELPAGLEASKVRDIISIEKQLAPISPEEISFWSMVGGYYMCSVGEVFKTACPASRLSREEVSARSRQREEERRRKALEALARKEEKRLADMARLEARISRTEDMLAKARNETTRSRYRLQIDTFRSALDALRGTVEVGAPGCSAETGDMLHNSGAAPSRNVVTGGTEVGVPGCSAETRDMLHNSGTPTSTNAVTEVSATVCSAETGDMLRDSGTAASETTARIVLSGEQEKAAEKARKAFGKGRTALLHGVTGSGKTEIYCTLALEAMARGENVLYLVPEIAMSRQLETRLEACFGDSLMVFHSHETDARRGAVADRLASSEKGLIILGTRSALFLPHRRLGLIIVDEEHDGSYKQESPAPRYNGRDAALMLASVHAGCNAILGSATPSLESLYNCKTGKYEYIRLDRKYHGAAEAEVEVIDTIAERKKNGMVGEYSRKLIDRMEKALAAGGQVLILRSRRSYSPAVQCSECGEIPKCPRCNVSLSLHKNGPSRLVCHHCGYSISTNGFCRSCGGALTGIGAGTQKLEEEARTLFPGARIERLDSDTAKNPRFEEETVRKFAAGETDILIGTQIVAKGFDFGGLSLVVVMAADSLLAVEDFRADEKALQLLEQVRGRCGRRDSKGLVVVQTARPQHPVFSALSGLNRIPELMEERAAFGYPPYMRIVTLSVADRFEDRCRRDAQDLAAALGNRLGDVLASKGMSLVGPFAPGQGKEAGAYLQEIRISLRRDKSIRSVKERLLSAVRDFEKESKGRVKVAIDVDPL